jgi:hypothetical protein
MLIIAVPTYFSYLEFFTNGPTKIPLVKIIVEMTGEPRESLRRYPLRLSTATATTTTTTPSLQTQHSISKRLLTSPSYKTPKLYRRALLVFFTHLLSANASSPPPSSNYLHSIGERLWYSLHTYPIGERL